MKLANSLFKETSPYLLSHAHQPVPWQAWRPETLKLAKSMKRPLFISIGYQTCHWCHVMARETFADPKIGGLLGTHFLPVKIDREERPDIDHYYMTASSLFGVQGGWPLNIFALPTGEPFFIGTYFAPVPKYNLPSFLQVGNHIIRLWEDQYKEVCLHAEKTHLLLKKLLSGDDDKYQEGSKKAIFNESQQPSFEQRETEQNNQKQVETSHRETGHRARDEDVQLGKFGGMGLEGSAEVFFVEDKTFFDEHWKFFDSNHGGFLFQSPIKFPCMLQLLHLLKIVTSKQLDERVLLDCNKMIRDSIYHMRIGGIYDQIAGGIARYSTDAQWKVPHFEKMLYDQAIFMELLSKYSGWLFKHQVDSEKDLAFLNMLVITLEELEIFLNEEMLDKSTDLFYCSIHAESEGVEGLFYLFSQSELEKVLGEQITYFYDSFSLHFDNALLMEVKSKQEGWTSEHRVKQAPIDLDGKPHASPAKDTDEDKKTNHHEHQEDKGVLLANDTLLDTFDSRSIETTKKAGTLLSIQFCNQLGDNEYQKKILPLRGKLSKYRKKRIHPEIDKKLLLGWNGLLLMAKISHFELLARFETDRTCMEKLRDIMRFARKVKQTFFLDDDIYRCCTDKKKSQLALLTDVANYGLAMLRLYKVSLKKTFLEMAEKAATYLVENHYHSDKKVFCETHKKEQAKILTMIYSNDSVEPGGNAVAAHLFLELSRCQVDRRKAVWFEQFSDQILNYFSTNLEDTSSSYLLGVLHDKKRGFLEWK